MTEDATLTVKLLVAPNGDGVTGFGVKDPHVIPLGRESLTHENVIGWLVPEVRVAVAITVLEPPAVILTGPLFVNA